MFMFALVGEGIEAAEHVIDETRVAHDDAVVRHPVTVV